MASTRTSELQLKPMVRNLANQNDERERERHPYDVGDDSSGQDLCDDSSSQVRIPLSKAESWALMPSVRQRKEIDEKDGRDKVRLGVTWKELQINGYSADHAILDNVISQFNIPGHIKESRHKVPLKSIIETSSGCVKPGEMLLVLGRPGAGCTSLLKVLSNRREGFAEVKGDVHFGSMDENQAKDYAGQIAINTEDELFFPTLTVGQTLDFATRMKVPAHLPSEMTSDGEWQRNMRDFLLEAMGIEHTMDTQVGDAYVRGVSGGERKRVSIGEALVTKGSIMCWDNSTRGLDASTALGYTKAIRALTDIMGVASIVTLYQAGNGIYNLFDKVLVLDEGKQIFYGPLQQARPFMEGLGYECDDSANIADFLTGVTVPTERIIKQEYKHSYPRTAEAIRDAYLTSPIKATMDEDLDFPQRKDTIDATKEFRSAIAFNKHKSLPKKSSLTVSFPTQVKICVIRQYQILWSDKPTLFIKQGCSLAEALITGSLFYNAPDTSSGLFLKSGTIFLGLLFNVLLTMSEVTDSFTGRPILAKHKGFAFYHPAAFCLAQVAADIPLLLFQVSVFSVILYFMANLTSTAEAFFTFWIVIFSVTICMTAFFRAIGAAFPNFDAASKISGTMFSSFVIYTGYMIPKTRMHPWFVWVYWINPLAYGFSSLLANEFHGKIIPCVNNNLIPNGPGYTNIAHQACAGVPGAASMATSVFGDEYLATLSYSHSNLWRNFGIIWAFWVLFTGTTIFFTSRWADTSSNSGFLLIPREKAANAAILAKDEESQVSRKSSRITPELSSRDGTAEDTTLIRNTSVFTWKNLTYTVKTSAGDRVLLDNVHGWVKPGMLGALMGSSGAGKTTLLDVLAQRKTEGTIHGSILVDGRPLDVSFQRSAGYCEQMDVHEPLATVREALEFSALLRQNRTIPKEEKLKYVDNIIDLLELGDIQHTLVGKVGAGLSVEQRKRLTIGVELVSKPSILIFLDEPTSGLDGQAAFNIVRFLKKLAAVGQAVLVTIHQPSALLFAQFDTLLLLAKGGKTVYFGDIGEKASTVNEYFATRGAPCPRESNPAEHMIDVVSGPLSQEQDWNKIWLDSSEYQQMMRTLDNTVVDAAGKEPGTENDGFEFATSMLTQMKLVTQRMNVSLYRNVDYVNNKFALHIISALFVGFSFWMIGNSVQDLQLCLFAIFNFIFVAPGVIAQLQPLFIDRRDIYETREKKSKMYSWPAFVTGLILSEIPYLCVCAVLYFACWYYTIGFPTDSSKAGATFFVMLMYEFIYTGIGQFIAAYAPNAVFASLIIPLFMSILIAFCGVLVPYAQLNVFWRYWVYYLNPFNYLMGSLLTFAVFDRVVECTESEFAVFNPPPNSSCLSYLTPYLEGEGSRTNLVNPDATSACRVCQYTRGSDYLHALNLNDYYYGWRDAAIVVIFVASGYGMVFALMKLRTKASKKAE